MKKLISVFLCASLLAGVTSCNFLDEEPRSKVTGPQFLKTASQALENTNRLYRSGAMAFYNAGSWNGANIMFGGYMSGYFENDYSGQEVYIKDMHELNLNSSNISGKAEDVWKDCYSAINVANAGLQQIPTISMDETLKDKYIAESKFFRAYNYYTLVRFFGAVPLFTEPTLSLEDPIYVKRNTVQKVYAQIKKDLEDAILVLPKARFYDNGNRVTKYAAEMLLANVCMQMSGVLGETHYAQAATLAKDVINSDHQLVQESEKVNPYEQLRTKDGLAESVFAYEFDSDISNSGAWPSFALDKNAKSWELKYSITNPTYYAVAASSTSFSILDVYEAEDIRGQEKVFFAKSYTDPSGKEHTLDVTGSWYFYDHEAMTVTGRGTKDINIYRLAEAYLIAAEAIAQSEGVTDEAKGYLAAIRARGYNKTVDEVKATLPSEKEAFIKEVWIENLREFPLEFKLWDMIVRTKQYPQAQKGGAVFVNLIGAQNNFGKTYKESDLVFPISANEIQRNPALTQDPE